MASGGRGGGGGVPGFVHRLSKDARISIIQVLAAQRTHREVAEMLGVTPAAVTKYLYRRTHPSDAVILRALEAAGEEELKVIADIMLDDLLGGIKSLIDWALDNGLLAREDIRKIEEAIYPRILLLAYKRGGAPRPS
ncbi:MAG: DNA-binding protein [Desulfurococcales archaeon]|nr:DNA-binding protein [Desulfurococcales archaeon]